jgi:hypothetical protein
MAGAKARRVHALFVAVCGLWGVTLVWPSPPGDATAHAQTQGPAAHAGLSFQTGNECMACHNGLTTPAGEDVSIGVSWRSSMMAHSARDPYWQGAVRRESIDHPEHAAAIEDECSICHMPMTTYPARMAGGLGRIFEHLPIGRGEGETDRLAADGVSCTVCHQITAERLGSRDSFTGGYVLNVAAPGENQAMFGPYQVDQGRAHLMRSATGLTPTESAHVRQSEVCATCHTLFTQAFDPDGKAVGTLPEQVPYLEWQHSAYREEQSCQACHMPPVAQPTRIASVVGEPREGMSRHTFLGGNVFMLRMLNRYRTDLGVTAPPQELEATAVATERQLQMETAAVGITGAARTASGVSFTVSVENSVGHKFPTGYPSRRAWLHVTVRDHGGRVVFESGAVAPTGAITGNDNDADATRYEPHYEEIRSADEVQIYEPIMVDSRGVVTTGLLSGVRYVKDNRLLPRGFAKSTASSDVAVHGGAFTDADFDAGGDRVRYALTLPGAQGPLAIEAELRYQTIAYRWARNFASYDAAETRRFVSYYDAMASGSSIAVARAAAAVQ